MVSSPRTRRTHKTCTNVLIMVFIAKLCESLDERDYYVQTLIDIGEKIIY